MGNKMKNLVAKNAYKYNRSVIEPDKKKDYTRKLKHKHKQMD